MKRPLKTSGLRHVALVVSNFEESLHFYHDLLCMAVEWQPDRDNIYLTSGNDNLALHRAPENFQPNGPQRLDHLGFILDSADEVDHWHAFLKENGVKIKAFPKNHRDGTRSFYCYDPDGNSVQMIFHPHLLERLGGNES